MEEGDEWREYYLEPFESVEAVEESIRISIEHWPRTWGERRNPCRPLTGEQIRWLADWCRRHEIKQESLAQEIGVSRQRINQVLSGATPPKRERASKLVYTASKLASGNPKAINELILWFWKSIDPSGEGRKAEVRAYVIKDLRDLIGKLNTANLGRLLQVARGLDANERISAAAHNLEMTAMRFMGRMNAEGRRAHANATCEDSQTANTSEEEMAAEISTYAHAMAAAEEAHAAAVNIRSIADVDGRMAAHALEAERQTEVRFLLEQVQMWPDMPPSP